MRASARKFSQKVVGEGGLRVLSTLFVLLLARYLGAEDFGRYSSALAFAAVCIVFVDLGTNSILTRDLARRPEAQVSIASTSHFLKLLASAGAWLILLAATYVLNFRPDQRAVTLCLGIVVIGQTMTEYFSALLSGMEEMGWEATLKFFSRLLGLSFGFIALALHKSLPVIVFNMAAGTLASYMLSVLILRYRLGSFGFAFDSVYLKSLCRSSAPLFATVLFWILYDNQDILLLNYFHFPQRDIGWFSAAMKIIDVLRVYPVLVLGVFFPTLSKLHIADPGGFERKERKLYFFVFATLCLGAGILYIVAPLVIRILYKADFLGASYFLRLLLPALVGLGMNFTQSQILIALNQEKKLLWAAVAACVCNVLFAFLLLPKFGVPGTCYALWGSELVYFLILRQARRPVI